MQWGQMRASTDRGWGYIPDLPSRGGAVAFAVNGATLHCGNRNVNVKSCGATPDQATPLRSAGRKKVGSRTPSSLLHHTPFAEYRVVSGRDRRRKRIRAGGRVAGEELRMTAMQQEELLGHEVEAKGLVTLISAFEAEGRWQEAVDAVKELRDGGGVPSQAVSGALVNVLLRSQQLSKAADVLEQAMAEDRNREIPVDVALAVMKGLLSVKDPSRVITIYRLLRVHGYIGRRGGGRSNARKTTLASCYGGQAAESLLAWNDVVDIYKLYLADKKAAGGGGAWEAGLGASLPCVVFRTLYKAKQYEEALLYLQDALSAKLYCNTILCNMAINCLGKTKRWNEAMEVFYRMKTDLGSKPDGMTHSVIINAFALSGRWEEAVALFEQAITDQSLRQNSSAMTACLNSAIHACDKAGRGQEALALLRRATSEGVTTDMITFSTTMNALVHSDMCDDALMVFEEMISRKLEPGLVACNYVLTHFSKYRRGQVALQFLEIMKKAKLKITAVSYNAVITALHREDKPEKVLSTFREMRLYRLSPDPFAVHQCLTACDTLEIYEEAADVIRGMWKMGAAVDARMYTKAFSVLARGAHTEAVKSLMGDMEARGVEPVEGCYTSLISAYCKAERFVEAEELLHAYRAAGKPIRTAAFTTVISSCKQGRNWRRAMCLFEEMQGADGRDQIRPNQYTYNALIAVLTFSGCLELATAKFQEMQEVGFEYDQLTFVNMILGFARQGRYEDVLVMFRGLEALTAANTQNGVWIKRQKGYWGCYNEALKGCEREGDYEMARRLLRSMRHQSMTIDVVIYGSVIGACARAGRWKEALETLREMEATDKVAPNVVCYSSAITACEKSGEWRKALHLLLKMINSGVQPDTIAYNASISASAKCGEWQMALKLFDSLARAGLYPDFRTYSAAILACFKGQQWQKAMELFGWMVRDGKLPDKHVINLVVELLDSHGQYDKAVYVFETAFRARGEPNSWDPSNGDVIDLHGYSAAVAKAAIRSGLQRLLRRFLTAEMDPDVVRDFTFITGQGKHSRRPFEPVLRPVAQDMFLEEFDPPLVSRFYPDNAGRLKVCKEDLVKWCTYQSEKDRDRVPSPSDALASLKLRDVDDLRREFDKAVAAGGTSDTGSGIGWTRNENEH